MANLPTLIVTNDVNRLSNLKIREAIADAPTMKGKVIRALPKNGVIPNFIQSLIENVHYTKEPFYVLDFGIVSNLVDTWTNSLPTIQPFYAVKCNPDPYMLAAMAALGSSFDCASRAEIESILALGVSPDQIIFANPCKPESHIKYAASVGVNLTTFDSLAEVKKIRKFHPKTSLLIRINPPEDGEAICPLGEKYGALPEEIEPLLRAAQAAGLPVTGVAFHIGSGASNTGAYTSAIEAARNVFDTAARLGLPPMRVLDVGGGFTAGSKFGEAASAIKAAIQTHFPDELARGGLRMIAEPGRFFAESAFTLAANVIGKRVRGKSREYWINDGIYGSLLTSAVMEAEHVNITCIALACNSCRSNPTCKGAEKYSSTVFGPTCDSLDTVVKGYWLPELEVDDWIVFPNMGAYTSAIKSNFNGFNTSPFATYLAYSNVSY